MSQSVILLFGGESRERLVSVATAQNMVRALTNPTCWFWSVDEKVYEISSQNLLDHTNPFLEEFKPKNKAKYQTLQEALNEPDAQTSVFVLAIHGGRGENGTIQKWFEEKQIAFTGSGSESCHITFDKIEAKKIIEALRIKTAPSITVQGNDLKNAKNQLEKFLNIHHKLAFKPVADGSSFGFISIANSQDIELAIEQMKIDQNCLFIAESYIDGVELTIGVIEQEGELIALPCTEIRKQEGRLFDYEGKYLAKGVTEITPAEVDDNMSQMAQRVALLAHEAFHCRGYSRTDIIISNNIPFFLETNSLPGLTKASLVTQQLSIKAISMRTFLNEQIKIALKAKK